MRHCARCCGISASQFSVLSSQFNGSACQRSAYLLYDWIQWLRDFYGFLVCFFLVDPGSCVRCMNLPIVTAKNVQICRQSLMYSHTQSCHNVLVRSLQAERNGDEDGIVFLGSHMRKVFLLFVACNDTKGRFLRPRRRTGRSLVKYACRYGRRPSFMRLSGSTQSEYDTRKLPI